MINLIPVIRILTGCGVSFRVDYPHKLIINASPLALEGVDLTLLKRNRHLLINSLPVGLTVTASQLLKAMDNYQLDMHSMRTTGCMEYHEAEFKALPLMRDYIRSLVSE